MISKLLCSDVLAIRCIDNLIFVGIGCTLHIFNFNTYKLEQKINCLYPYNIHGIVEGPTNKIAVFGANVLCTYIINKKQGIWVIKEDFTKKYLDDWIIAVNWVTSGGCDYLCVLLAHNNVHIYNTSNMNYENIYCEEKCILYAGSIFVKNKDMIIFSGTVFQEILIWKISNTVPQIKSAPVLHRLQGHNGVIFSVIYDPFTQLICSTSDDRTVRLWKVSSNENKENSDVNWEEAEIKLLRTMFGHTARVWKSILKNGILITIGEDSLMCTWSLDGKLLNKICAHHGAAIWSIDISGDNENVFTGGADGAVHAWSLNNNYTQKVIPLPKIHAHSSPKYICCLKSGSCLVFNEDGTAYIFNKFQNYTGESMYLERYSTYCVMEVSLCHNYVCFASRDGYIAIYKEINDISIKNIQQILEEKIMESQILSIQWLTSNKLIACGLNGTLKIFSFNMKGLVTIESVCLLPPSQERWLTAAVLYENVLVCGDRTGNMHVYNLQELTSSQPYIIETNKPIQTFKKIHGKIGVQNFIIMNTKLVSAGRDGILRFYELSTDKNKRTLVTLHREKMPMDWISGSLKVSNDILILGFKEVEFVIYSILHNRTIARIPCGGGHRSWDCILLNESVIFYYIRNKQVYAFDISLNLSKSLVLLNGFHTKEVNCITPVSKIGQNTVFVSGGNDGTLRISSVSGTSLENNFCFQTLGIFYGHLSSIKCLVSINLESNVSYNKHLVFSGGGRAQLKIWEIVIKNNETCLQSSDISCYDITSHRLYTVDSHHKTRRENNNQSCIMQPETRYMDIDVYRCTENKNCYVLLFVASADGYVRIFLYDIKTKSISVKVHAKCGDRCITKIKVLTYRQKILILTMSTDGIGRFIDFTGTISNILSKPDNKDEGFEICIDTFLDKFNLHQSGITSYDLKMIKENEYLLATGGDDNLFNLVNFKIDSTDNEKELNVSLLSRWSTSNAHFAQITGIRFYNENQIFSIGLDQQLVTYSYEQNEVLSGKIIKKNSVFATDTKGLSLWHTSKDELNVCVYGKGFEVLSC